MDTEASPGSVTPYQSWGILTGGCQEASAVTVHDVPVLQKGMKAKNANSAVQKSTSLQNTGHFTD